MKSKLTLTTLLASSLIPLSALAQTGATGTSGVTGNSRSSDPSQSQSTSQSGSMSRDSQSTTSSTSRQQGGQNQSIRQQGMQSSSSSLHAQNIKQVSEDQLKHQTTADKIIGAKVVDRSGQKIGKVKDVGLSQAMQSSSSATGQSSDRYSASGSVGGVSASGSVGTGGTSRSIGSASLGQSNQINVIVELDSDVGVSGNRLAAIPASSLQFDSEKEELTLQLDRQELSSILQRSQQGSAYSAD